MTYQLILFIMRTNILNSRRPHLSFGIVQDIVKVTVECTQINWVQEQRPDPFTQAGNTQHTPIMG